jgi:hypothetical protein
MHVKQKQKVQEQCESKTESNTKRGHVGLIVVQNMRAMREQTKRQMRERNTRQMREQTPRQMRRQTPRHLRAQTTRQCEKERTNSSIVVTDCRAKSMAARGRAHRACPKQRCSLAGVFRKWRCPFVQQHLYDFIISFAGSLKFAFDVDSEHDVKIRKCLCRPIACSQSKPCHCDAGFEKRAHPLPVQQT